MNIQESCIERALVQLENKNAHQALQIIEGAPFSDKQIQNLEYVRALCYIELGNLTHARSSLEKEISVYPHNHDAKALLVEVENEDRRTTAIDTHEMWTAEKINERAQDAIRLFQSGQPLNALTILDEITASNLPIHGLRYIKALCLKAVNRLEEALEEATQELFINPAHGGARQEYEALSKVLNKKSIPSLNPEQRPYDSVIPYETMSSIEEASSTYAYRSVPMQKNPFDIALYQTLLWDTKPRSIIEIGSKQGGSALWFADALATYGVDGHIYSIGIERPQGVSHPRVTFLEGNKTALEKTLSPEFLKALPRPLLVVKSSDNSYETSSAVMNFFNTYLASDEYIIIEDSAQPPSKKTANGFSDSYRAIQEFIAKYPGEYSIDSTYVDFFGYNVTSCTNGFLKKNKYPINRIIPKSVITEFNEDDSAPLGIESQMSTNERFQLYSAIRNYQPNRNMLKLIEVGSYSGASLQLEMNALKRHKLSVVGYTVEPAGTSQFYEVTAALPEVTHLKMFSHDASNLIKQDFEKDGALADIIMIDGDHSYQGVRQDILDYYPLLAQGGLMIFHDFLPALSHENHSAIMFHHGGNEPGIRQACIELMEQTYRCDVVELPLLYPTDPTQTQSHLPIIPGVFNTVRVYRKK